MAILLTLATGCGGGGNPILPDMAGLEGTWDYNVIYDGVLSGDGGDVPIADTIAGFFLIGRNSVVDDEGTNLVWSYDGATLTLKDADSLSDFDVDCGDLLISGSLEMVIPLASGATNGAIGGTIKMTVTTEFCGIVTGTFVLTGNMTKR